MEFSLTDGISISLWIVIVGFFIGGVSSAFGVGGGFLLVPILSIVFGVPANLAVGSSLAQMAPTSLFGIVPHWRKGNIVWQVPAVFFCGAALGIEIGAWLQNLVKDPSLTFNIMGKTVAQGEVYLLAGLSLVFLLQGSFQVYETTRIPRTSTGEPGIRFTQTIRKFMVPPVLRSERGFFEPFPMLSLVVIGFFGGAAIGFLGLGGGFVAVPIFIYFVGMDTKKAIGSSLLMVFMASVWGMFRHGISGRENVDWGIALSVVIGSFVGSQAGAWLNSRVKPQNIRRSFGFIILSMSVLLWVSFFLKLMLRS